MGFRIILTVDRVVHHSVILELNLRSYREEEALGRKGKKPAGTKEETAAKEAAP